MFDVFTARALKVVAFADGEAREIGWSYIGSEHLLLGMLVEGKGTAARALRSAAVEVQSARAELLHHISPRGGAHRGACMAGYQSVVQDLVAHRTNAAERR